MEDYEVFVTALDGRHLTVKAFETDTILDFKNKVSKFVGVTSDRITIIFNEKACEDRYTLKDYSIQKGCNVTCVMSLKGG